MHAARRIAVLGLVIAVAIPGSATAAKRITGKLTAPGYKVIAVAANGKVTSARAKPKFNLRPPAELVTLHLRTRDGSYGGPIVVGKAANGRKAILGVQAGAGLGRVKVKRRDGYASARVRRSGRDPTRWARANRGVPIGAGKFGFVKSKRSRGGAPGDRDLDGVANPLDVDRNGNRILDNLDRGGSAAARPAQSGESFFSHLFFGLSMEWSANVNAGSTDEQIDSVLPMWAFLGLAIAGDGAELDCGGVPDPNDSSGWIGGLSYCTRGGTGRLAGGAQSGETFPDCCDTDADGQGTMVNNINNPALGSNMMLNPRATADQIRTGDVLIQRVPSSGREFVTTIQYSIATSPALVSYDDGRGNSATVSYPVAGPNPGPPGPGTQGNPFPVKASAAQDAKVTVVFWRPQRRPLPTEPGFSDPPTAWTDIGGLLYEVSPSDTGSFCPRSAFTEGDPNLSVSPSESPPGLMDAAPSVAASPTNTLRFTVNLTTCAESPVATTPRGEEPAPPVSFAPGETRCFGFQAASLSYANGSSATQGVCFRRE